MQIEVWFFSIILFISSLFFLFLADGIEDGIKHIEQKKRQKLTFSEEDWQNLNELQLILKTFQVLTKYLSYKVRPTLSLLLPLVIRLKTNLGILL
jgi:hypothetical protein